MNIKVIFLVFFHACIINWVYIEQFFKANHSKRKEEIEYNQSCLWAPLDQGWTKMLNFIFIFSVLFCQPGRCSCRSVVQIYIDKSNLLPPHQPQVALDNPCKEFYYFNRVNLFELPSCLSDYFLENKSWTEPRVSSGTKLILQTDRTV